MAECMTAATSGFKWQNTVDLSRTDIVVEVVDDLAVVPGIVVADPALDPAVGLGQGPAADLVPNGEILDQDQGPKSNLQEEINQDQYLSQDLSLDPSQHQDHDQDHKIIAGSYVRIYKNYVDRYQYFYFYKKETSQHFFSRVSKTCCHIFFSLVFSYIIISVLCNRFIGSLFCRFKEQIHWHFLNHFKLKICWYFCDKFIGIYFMPCF